MPNLTFMVSAAAVYARISSDQAGTGQGVTRQLEDCRKLAAGRGWRVAEEYVDNDVSAYSGRERPAYQRMLADLRLGVRDAVIVYNLDRLTRRPIELEELTGLCAEAGVTDLATVTADINLGTDDGLLMARVYAAFAAKESAAKSRRMLRKYDQLAEQGLPKATARRAFGYEQDGLTVRADEAELLRTLVARFLAGESLRGLTVWIAGQVPTGTQGGPWRSPTVRGIITNPRYAGLRVHRGQVVGPAVWPALISAEEHHQVLARIAREARTGRRTPRRYLLSGMVFCGQPGCLARLYSAARAHRRRYVCTAGPDHDGGCGRLTVVAEPLEAWVTEAVLLRLTSPDMADALDQRTEPSTRDLAAAIDADQAQLEELAAAWAGRLITMPEWREARAVIERRLDATADRLAQITTTAHGDAARLGAEQLRAAWPDLGLPRQRAVVEALVSEVVIRPGTAGARALDPGRVAIGWRRH